MLTSGVRRRVQWGVEHGLPRLALRAAARRGDLQGRLVLAAAGTDPAVALEVMEEVRASGRLHRTRLAYMTADHALVKQVLSSKDFVSGLPGPGDNWVGRVSERLTAWSAPDALHPMRPPSLLVTEPPDHTRYRRLVTGVFTARAVERLRHRTEEIAAGLLDDLAAGPVDSVDRVGSVDSVDLVDRYCALLPVTVISEVLGVRPEDRPHVLRLGSAAAASLDLGLPWERYRPVDEALVEFDRWLTDHLHTLRRDPGEDLMSQLVQAQEGGVGLTERELKATAGLVLVAGFETTVNLLGNGVALLDEHPDQRAALRADPTLWANAVEEVLRLDPPVLLTARTAARDTELVGTRIPAGALVTTLLAGANRDPGVFAEPGRFDVTRENARDHLSFSAGRHHCLGAALARMEGEVGLRALTERFPDLRLQPGARRRSTRILRGYEHLPAVLGQR